MKNDRPEGVPQHPFFWDRIARWREGVTPIFCFFSVPEKKSFGSSKKEQREIVKFSKIIELVDSLITWIL